VENILKALITISGRVQGVGFRPFIYRLASKKGLRGYVRNRNGVVEVLIEGNEKQFSSFLEDLKKENPPSAIIQYIKVEYLSGKEECKDFKIELSPLEKAFSGSIAPADLSICDECIVELMDPKNRRFNYFFITCTNCGPRFTIITDLPYDRVNTTMKKFIICEKCEKEYKDPLDRRFHAQTIACCKCGPKAYLTEGNGEILDFENPIVEAGKLIEEGFILAVKGNGGFHIATSTLNSKPIIKLRKVKHRSQKPFAIMAKNIEAAASFAEISPKEAELLKSPAKPIVLLKKSENYYLAEEVSPGLDTVGVMLPYTGLHLMLFKEAKEPAFVMTSANPPNQPIATTNQEAIEKFREVVDYYLFHDRDIAQRCDDSVVKVVDGELSFIRRSKGYAPEPIKIKEVKNCVLGVGAELNVTSCIILKDKAFLSQHIGDVENLETLNFLEEATRHLIKLTKSEVDCIACDLHPTFNTTRLALRLSEEINVPVFQIQHHHAHIAKLMAEYSIDEIIGIACDGFGYGVDGSAWGGEILYCFGKEFKRLGYLEKYLMIGGDLATKYPLRMVAAILKDEDGFEEWFLSKADYFPHGRIEAEIILENARKTRFPETSSCGRLLDAVSAVLGVCYERTYEGEPAMKLEATAKNGKNILNTPLSFKGSVIETKNLLKEIFNLIDGKKENIKNLAYSAQEHIAKSLVEYAVAEAEKLGVKFIGFSGGVAANEHITRTIRKIVEENNLRFVYPRKAPCGDGGVSLGQAYIAAQML
jgi:hydrogenase maturation protein HypF